MADPVYNAGALTRDWWAGADADQDIHIEAYEGDVEGSFKVESIFRSMNLTRFKSVMNQSNTWRGDRIGAAKVQGRKSGQKLDGARIANDKFIVTVDTTSFIRTPFDYQDDWTAPDFQAEYSAEHGTAHAKAFDEAHIITLIKCSAFVAPAHLAGSFKNGLKATTTGLNAATAREDKAAIIVQTHKGLLKEFVKRDLGGSLSANITLMEPDTFDILLDEKKLMNVEYQGGNGDNNYAARRVAWLNGTRVIETPRFPTAVITDHLLGPDFNVTAAEAKACFIVFNPSKALVTVEAKAMTVRKWDDPKDFQSVLDSYTMYTVGQYRPDAVGVGFRE
ncbi:major capsid protein [Pseudomonas phage Misse]|uniref:Major capsid protein n=1 Tax=Pseudomonas phage Bertil TaxID=2801385 RepID=A0A7T8EQE8_9CAUD|nr:major capsid protein [Pseudomonas phage Bertil]QQO90853.1 major capsid protein [Pseudomonas phage Misse]QQO90904.1 major capsid protein [Pseudomonas phage Strit]